jgi:hypothetical protein
MSSTTMPNHSLDLALLLSSSLGPVQEHLMPYIEPGDILALSLVSKAVKASLDWGLQSVRILLLTQ